MFRFVLGLVLLVPTLVFSYEIPAVKVKVVTPRSEDLYDLKEVFGECRARLSQDINSQINGIVTAVPAKNNSNVKNGQTLIEIDGPKAKAEYDAANATYQRENNLYKNGIVSKGALEKAKSNFEDSAKKYGQMIIIAPFDGRIGVIKYHVGDTIATGDIITSITGIGDEKEFIAHLPSDLIDSVTTDTQVKIVDKGNIIEGQIISISPHVTKAADNFTVAIEVTGTNNLRHGGYNKIHFLLNPHKGFVIPQKAVMNDNNGSFVFTVNNENKVDKKYIKSGIRFGDNIEILDDVSTDTKVVVEGLTKINQGDVVDPLLTN